MARVRLFGTTFNADPVEERPDGWLMRSRAHTARTTHGTLFFATHKEIIEMAAAEVPVDLKVNNRLPAGTTLAEGFTLTGPEEPIGAAALEKAMADERETLPSFAEIDAANGNTKKRQERADNYLKEMKGQQVGEVRKTT